MNRLAVLPLLLALLGAAAQGDPDAASRAAFQRWQARVRPFPAARLPRIGSCYATRIKARQSRLVSGPISPFAEGNPADSSGSAVLFENGLYQVDYNVTPGIVHSRRGDPVRLCVVSLPRHCPAGDRRGITYRATNLRTGAAWTLPDAEHMCGGA